LLIVAALACALGLSLSACGDSDDDGGDGGSAQESAQDGRDGGSGSGSGDTESVKELTPAQRKAEAQDQQQVVRASSGLYAALADRNGKALCRHLTDEARREFAKGGQTCVAYYQDLIDPVASKGTRDRSAARAKIGGIDVNGDEAIATVTFDRKNSGVIELTREDGAWKVKSFTIPRTIAGTI
jgi:hypothetical protein